MERRSDGKYADRKINSTPLDSQELFYKEAMTGQQAINSCYISGKNRLT